MSAATAPMAIVEAVEENIVKPGDLILVPAFGAGLTWSAQLIRWGQRCEAIGESDVKLPESKETALEIIKKVAEIHLKNPS